MADTKEPPKAVVKGARRASFARALHVPAIGRRKQVHAHRSAPSQDIAENTPQHLSSPQLATVFVNTHQASTHDEEGADIPDIPLRRIANMERPSVNYNGPRLHTLEQMLAEDGPQELLNYSHFGPIHPNSMVSRGNKRYSAHLTAFWEPPLLPQLRDSRNRSLSDVPEASPASSIRFGAEPPSEPLTALTLPPWRESHSAPVSTTGSVVSAQEARSPSTYPRSFHDREIVDPSITSAQTEPESPLPALQTKGADEAGDALEPVAEEDTEPGSFDLVVPATNLAVYSLERRSELLFSVDHLRVVFDDPILLHRFTNFISIYRPGSVPLLRYYLDALKAIRAMEWVNSIVSKYLCLDGHEFAAKGPPQSTENESLRHMSTAALEVLARDELPAYITHTWTEIVEMSMKRRITGTLPAHLHDMSDGLAEVFCITDPSRTDNPIVFSSEEFHRTTQYGLDYVIGRNCRFLQGPKTNPFAVKRIRENLEQGKVHYETFLNYRRDGSPFMNLLMCAPLIDSTGTVRYFLGAQIDVSGLAKGCSGLESLRRLVDQNEEGQNKSLLAQEVQGSHIYERPRRNSRADCGGGAPSVGTEGTESTARGYPKLDDKQEDEFRLLCEMFNGQELETARRFGGRMHRSQQEQVQHLESISNWHKRRVVIQDSSENSPPATPRQQHDTETHGFNGDFTTTAPRTAPTSPASPPFSAAVPMTPTTLRNPRAPTIYENYLIVRPYPSLRILFASPSLRVPGILQSHLMSRVGGSRRIHEELEQAFALGQGVTAKVKWISGGARGETSSSNGPGPVGKEGRPRWIHCTPLIGSNGNVGVWVIVIIDEDTAAEPYNGRRQMRRDVSSPTFNGKGGAHRYEKRRDRDSSLWDAMSLTDFAAMNSLPDDEDLRQHVKDMFGEVRRRERAARGERGARERPEDVVKVKTNGSGIGSRAAELRRGNGVEGGVDSRSSSPFT
ncbi:Phototropin-2 [Cytospora mali]|uniref:Phototropin-2 n=1 Tax=Cytospora mali TaxID=578113 RepID=A0A194V4J1_CYTMA|nr:Phototropin-2 [Valsa mali var. pyri (nom. inval.)]